MLTNLFADIPAVLPEEFIDVLCAGAKMRIERIVSQGHASPAGFWYDQDEREWVVLLRGAARLRFEAGDAIEMRPGDFVNISAHRRHRVEWTTPTEPTIWLAVFSEEPRTQGGLGPQPNQTAKHKCNEE